MKVLAVLAAALLLAAPAAAKTCRPTLANLETQIICPTCRTTLDQSSSPIADRIRAFIRARIAAGDCESDIKAKLVAQFGPSVLAAPPKKGFNLLAWVLPLAGVLAGAAVLAGLAWRWSRRREPAQSDPSSDGPVPLEPELEQRLDEELARFDA